MTSGQDLSDNETTSPAKSAESNPQESMQPTFSQDEIKRLVGMLPTDWRSVIMTTFSGRTILLSNSQDGSLVRWVEEYSKDLSKELTEQHNWITIPLNGGLSEMDDD